MDFIYFNLHFVSLQSSSVTTSTETEPPSAAHTPSGLGNFAASRRQKADSPLPPAQTGRGGVLPQGLRRPLPDVPLFLVHSGVEEEDAADNPTIWHHCSTPVLAPAKGTVKETVRYETVAEHQPPGAALALNRRLWAVTCCMPMSL